MRCLIIMKIYKNIQKAFGGAALYLDKTILKHLGVIAGDEVVIELVDDKVIISKPTLDAKKIKELLSASEKFKK